MNEAEALIHIDDQEAGMIDLAGFIQSLHSKWQPHSGQIGIGRALFYEGFKDIFACCGRNFGKTEVISYLLWRYAGENTKSENYCFGPVQKQIKEILWASGRIQGLGPEEYRQAINNTEMRVTLNNGSFIKLDGSDNVDAYRGIKPKGLSVYDEFKDMRPDFITAYDPNRAAFDSPAIYIGTPPEFENHFVHYMEKAKKYHGDSWYYVHAPSSANPYLSRRFLDNKKKELLEAGDEETWLREYEAIYVKGGKRHIIPQAVRYNPIKYDFGLFKVLKEWDFFVICDPASSSTFGVLFVAHNRYSKHSIVFDEIYEQEQERMTARQIWQQIFKRTYDLSKLGVNLDSIQYVYDEAASWFRNETNEISDCKRIFMQPTQKSQNSKESGISIIRDAFNRKVLDITDNCVKLKWELDSYMKDERGNIPKENDHLIDDLRYFFAAIGYNLHEEDIPKEADPYLQRRGIRLEEDMPANNNLVDFDNDFSSNSSLEGLD
jgi:hypothetical protein